jgi:hypothetical protein
MREPEFRISIQELSRSKRKSLSALAQALVFKGIAEALAALQSCRPCFVSCKFLRRANNMKDANAASSWPEFTHDKGELHPENTRIKKEIAAKYGENGLWQSWITTCTKLNETAKGIAVQQTQKIPELHYDEVFSLSEERKATLKATGCFVDSWCSPQRDS